MKTPCAAVALGLIATHAYAGMLNYKAVVARARRLAHTPYRETVRASVAQRAGSWDILARSGRRQLQVRGGGSLIVTVLGVPARTDRKGALRIIDRHGGAVLLESNGVTFEGRPAGAVGGTRAAVIGAPKSRESFTHFWVRLRVRPLVVYALVNGPDATAAVRFAISAGGAVHMLVRATVFLRHAVSSLELSPLCSEYWYGVANHTPAAALYPAVHDADGLFLQRSPGVRVWQPLADPRHFHAQVAGNGVSVFGLLQRDRIFRHYESTQGAYQKRPSVLVIVPGKAAHVVLEESPWCGNDNITAYWRLRHPPPPLAARTVRYRLVWRLASPPSAFLGRVITTLIGGDRRTGDVKYVIEYAGGVLGHAGPGVRAHVQTAPTTKIVEDRVERNPYTGGFRQIIQLAPVAHRRLSIHAWLSRHHRPISEIWQYRTRRLPPAPTTAPILKVSG